MNLYDHEIEEDEFVGFLTDMEKFKIVEDLSDEILISSIKDQINGEDFELFQKNNHLEIFETRYQNTINYYKNNDLLIQELKNVRNDFYYEVEIALRNKFGIYINEDLKERYLIIKALYSHLILGSKTAYITFLFNFIQENKQTVTSIREINKSVEAFILKKKFKNKEIINLFSNLYPIVDYILDLELDPVNILKGTLEEGEVNSFIIHNNLSKIHFDDDFSIKYLNNIKQNRNNYFIIVTYLEQKLRNTYKKELMLPTPTN